jgi:hypothetical protein
MSFCKFAKIPHLAQYNYLGLMLSMLTGHTNLHAVTQQAQGHMITKKGTRTPQNSNLKMSERKNSSGVASKISIRKRSGPEA